MTEQNNDPELQAMTQIMQALAALDVGARSRVVSYVFQRLGLAPAGGTTGTQLVPPLLSGGGLHTKDILSLKEAKMPKTDLEMAALVAYYLKNLAEPEERKETINKDDIEKYFVQAHYTLPEKPQFTLPNAKRAGYLDSAGRGLYKLNPVGHNLVAHRLPSKTEEGNRRARKPRKSKKILRKSVKGRQRR